LQKLNFGIHFIPRSKKSSPYSTVALRRLRCAVCVAPFALRRLHCAEYGKPDKNWLTFYWSSLYVHGYWVLDALARITYWPLSRFYFTSLFLSGLKAHMFTVLPLIAGVAFDLGTYTVCSL